VNTPHGQTILVTGGSGFVGRHLVEALAPDNMVVSLQLPQARIEQPRPGVEYVYGDLASLHASDLPARIDQVFHEAALINNPGSPHDPSPPALLQANVVGTLQLLTVARELGIPRFVSASTGSVYRPAAMPVSEDAPLGPASFYGLSKRMSEQLVTWYGAEFQSVSILRYGTPVGRGCSNAQLRSILRHCTDGTPIDLGPLGGMLFNPIPVRDLVQLTLLAAGLDGSHVLNVGGIETLTFDDMARHIASRLGREAMFVDSPPRVGQTLNLLMHSERIRALVGYTADQPVSEAVAELVSWWRDSQAG